MTAAPVCATPEPMKTYMIGAMASAALMSACAAGGESPQDEFFAALSAQCGKAFTGRLVSTDETDTDFGQESMVMHVRTCSDDEIRIPFHVGEDSSRTWVVSREASGLRLKHDHRHEDGSEDALTQYGGDTAGDGTATRQEFPADVFSKSLFEAEGIPVSAANIWAVEVSDTRFAYELRRPNRHFRVEFDLAEPVPTPGPPWGAE